MHACERYTPVRDARPRGARLRDVLPTPPVRWTVVSTRVGWAARARLSPRRVRQCHIPYRDVVQTETMKANRGSSSS
jgi:hypothetical protein